MENKSTVPKVATVVHTCLNAKNCLKSNDSNDVRWTASSHIRAGDQRQISVAVALVTTMISIVTVLCKMFKEDDDGVTTNWVLYAVDSKSGSKPVCLINRQLTSRDPVMDVYS